MYLKAFIINCGLINIREKKEKRQAVEMYFLIKGRVLISTAIVILFSRYIDGVRKEKERLTAACAIK
jgi:hypothetical protein